MGVKKNQRRAFSRQRLSLYRKLVQMRLRIPLKSVCFESLHIKTKFWKKNIGSWQRRNQLQGICKRTYVKVIFDIQHTLTEWISSQLQQSTHKHSQNSSTQIEQTFVDVSF